MSEERRKILEMLSAGKISVEEAEKLLAAVGPQGEEAGEKRSPAAGFKYLRVLVEPGPASEKKERVNIRVPINLIRAGLKWAAFIPQHAQLEVHKALAEKGINIDLAKITPQDMEELIANLNDLTVDVEGEEKVRIFCEA
jgi:hypothetical protein